MRQCCLVVIAMLTIACGKGGPTSPSGRAESMTWTADGASFVASEKGRMASRISSVGLQFVGSDCQSTATLRISAPPNAGVGTYRIGDSGVSANWTPDLRPSFADQWDAPGRGVTPVAGSGSVTITAISDSWVSGTFEFQVIPSLSNRDTRPKTIQGGFELSISNRTTLC
jgi:Family of unknown function (DUF6252)